MFRMLLCTVLSVGLFSGFAQDKSLAKIDSIVSTGVCNCLSSSKTTRIDDLDNCIGMAIMQDSVLFISEVQRVMGDTSEQSAYEFGRRLSKRIMVDMIRDCDVFYHMFDSLRRSGFNELDLDSLRSVANALYKQSGNAPSVDYYFSQGLVHVREGKWAEGLADFDAVLKLKPDLENPLFFRAYCLENLGRYDEAIALYEYLANGTGKEDYRVFAAIVIRLKTGHLP